jgi:hypothetical protein
MMTFNALHKDLPCDCLSANGIAENTTDTFARRVRDVPPSLNDFKSFYERKHPAQQSDCDYLCKHRGVSIIKLNGDDETALKSKWAELVAVKPRSPRVYCKFRLKTHAGVVWPTPSRDDANHCTLLKSDQFSPELIDCIETVTL